MAKSAMKWINVSVFFLFLSFLGLQCAVVHKDVREIEKQGLYSQSDKVVILAKENIDAVLYGQKHGWLIQFYNSFCGHCRAFYPKFKEFAADVVNWRKVFRVGVIDCTVEDNIEVCRYFEVMKYPTLRYFHENYTKGNTNIGDNIDSVTSAEQVSHDVLNKLKDEQRKGRMTQLSSTEIANYNSLTEAVHDVPLDVKYTFLIFESSESLDGIKVILDTSDYKFVAVKRVTLTSQLARDLDVTRYPGLVAVRNDLQTTALTPKSPSRASLLNAINIFLLSKNMVLPSRESSRDRYEIEDDNPTAVVSGDVVYLADLETTLKSSLHTEITRYKTLQGEALQALLNYLSVLIDYFPFRGNGKEFLQELRGTLQGRSAWPGDQLALLVARLERAHAPVYASELQYFGCRGSEERYRGYTCGLWMLFHTLTVGAASAPGGNAPSVLRAMHGYVKHFFGCTECAGHFQAMAERNKIWDVRDNDKAVLWLWISHNEVNLRLAGDITEDPRHPKVQFPSVESCPECRLPGGAWRLPKVYRYLRDMYAADAVRLGRSQGVSNVHYGFQSLLYISIFIFLLLVGKTFVTGARRLISNRVHRRHALSLYAKKDYSCLK